MNHKLIIVAEYDYMDTWWFIILFGLLLKTLGKGNLIFLDLNTLEKLASKGKNTILPESQETQLGSPFTVGIPLTMPTLPRVNTILASCIISLLIYVIYVNGTLLCTLVFNSLGGFFNIWELFWNFFGSCKLLILMAVQIYSNVWIYRHLLIHSTIEWHLKFSGSLLLQISATMIILCHILWGMYIHIFVVDYSCCCWEELGCRMCIIHL